MRRILMLAVLFAVATMCVAQRQRNYVYVFDCTQSMNTDFHIWDKAKQWLKDDITRKDDDAIITVVPFRDHADDHITFEKAVMDWKKLEQRFDALISSPHGNTGICLAWDFATGYIKPGMDNFFIVLTDGKDVHSDSDCVKQRMRDWCGSHPNSYGYVVTLSRVAKEALWTDLSNCDDFCIIDGTGFIPRIGTFTEKRFTMLSHAVRDIKSGFSEKGTYKAHIKCNDPFYDIKLKNNQLNNNEAIFEIKQKKEPSTNHEVKFEIVSETKDLKLCKPNFSIFIDTRDLANLNFGKIERDEYNAGKVKTYSDFLFFDGKNTEKVDLDLGTEFNQRAKGNNCSMQMKASLPNSLRNKCKFYLNGKEISPSNFSISSNADKNILTIEIAHEAPECKYIINLSGNSRNLESINGEQIKHYNATIRVKHSIGWHPVKTFLFWLGIAILIALILWFIVFRPIFYPRFRAINKTIIIPNQVPISIHFRGARCVILDNIVHKQSGWNRFWTGKIIYKRNPTITYPITLKPTNRGRKILFISKATNYTCMPNPIGIQPSKINDFINKQQVIIQ